MKRIALAVAGAAVAGLTACSNGAGAPASAATITPRAAVSCSQQYQTWEHGRGDGVIAALSAVSSAAKAGNSQVLAAALKRARPAVADAVRNPVPACADPRGYWDPLLMHVTAAVSSKASVSSVRAAMKGVPRLEHELSAELQHITS